MAGKLVLALGGCRSGKSAFALKYAEDLGVGKTFVATSPVLDDEMARRIDRHRAERRGKNWRTVEEETALADAVAGCPPGDAVVIDCLTLWVNNVMHHEGLAGRTPDEDAFAALARGVVDAALARDGVTVAVANEVGLGVAPENALARRFRDVAGRVNQTFAAGADEVYFMVAGLPTRIR